MRVAIAYNEPTVPQMEEALREYEANMALYDAVECVERACEQNGWNVSRAIVGSDPAALSDAASRADVVVNFVEAIQDDARFESAAAWLLEWIGVPFTGSPGLALSLALDKSIAKACLATAGVRVAAGCVVAGEGDPIPRLRYPLIVKPVREDASIGIESGSVVYGEPAARAQAARIIERFHQPALIEEFIEGRDVTAALLTRGASGEPPELLPISEFDYTNLPAGEPRILTYDAKWDVASAAYMGSPAVYPDDLKTDTVARIGSVARDAWDAIGLRDYARVDMRVPPDGPPVVIDVNPNPDLSTTAGFAGAAARVGISYETLIRRIVEGALARGRTAPRVGP